MHLFRANNRARDARRVAALLMGAAVALGYSNEALGQMAGERKGSSAPPVSEAALDAVLDEKGEAPEVVAADASSVRGPIAFPPIAVRLDYERPRLLVFAGGQLFLRKEPTRFEVVEWGKEEKKSGRVNAMLTIQPPKIGETNAVFRGRGTAPGAPDPLFEWQETWETTPEGFRTRLELRNVANESVSVHFFSAGNLVIHAARPFLARERFHDCAFLDRGDVAIIAEGSFDSWYSEERTGSLLLPLHGNLGLHAGQQRVHSFSARLVPGSLVDPSLSAESVFRPRYRKLAEQFPRLVSWPDRRPILAVMTAASTKGYRLGYSTNPRGFIVADDVTTPEGLERFRKRMLTEARSLAAACRRANVQGVIIWDLEGQAFRHPVTYIGSPDRLLIQAPEMDEIADDYFAIFYDAGVRAGVCVRPQKLRLRPNRFPHLDPSNQFGSPKGGSPQYEQDGTYALTDGRFDDQRVLELLADKIGYAYRRWKATLFYIDSPVNLTPAILSELTRRFPDCLLIPEFAEPLWYGASAPLHPMPIHARRIWPEAFGVLGLGGFAGDNPTPQEVQTALREGHILLSSTLSSLATCLASNALPEWHDLGRMHWRPDQPVSRFLTEQGLRPAKGGRTSEAP